MATEILYAGLGLLAGVAVFWLWQRRAHSGEDPGAVVATLQREISNRLDRVTQQIDQRLRDNVHAMNESKSFLAARVSSTEKTVREVSSGLGRLEQATAALQRTNEEITSFQKLLKAPKIRGSFGEVMLTNLLADVLPHDRYETQFTMQSGDIADAIIRLQDGYIVAVDAKFPLANYELHMREGEGAAKETARKQSMRDFKKHITDISRKYIVPREKTLDYAFMYIPVEGVYYETMVHDPGGETLWEFCLSNRVIPVSPNSFLAYLQTVLVGLRGMKIQQQAQEILQTLGQVRRDFKVFSEDFVMVGKHLSNAKNRFDDSSRRLDKFSNRLDQIEISSEPSIPADTEITKEELQIPQP